MNLKRSWVDQFYTEVGLVQQRFNFFLVAVSFLFLAFATLVSGVTDQGGMAIAILIAVFGGGISLYFSIINYLQAEVARLVGEKRYCEPIADTEKKTVDWLLNRWCDAWKYPFKAIRPSQWAKLGPVSYTWFVPFAFFLLWLAVLGFFLGCWWRFSVLAVPLLITVSLLLCFWLGKRRTSRRTGTVNGVNTPRTQ